MKKLPALSGAFSVTLFCIRYGPKYNSSMYEPTVDIREVNEDWQFSQIWYNLKRIEILIVRGHGNAEFASSIHLGTAKLLQKRDIGVLLLEGCNCGHYDVPDNIAKTLSKKVTGFVIASDGEVKSLQKEHMYYRSAGEDKFVEWREIKSSGSTRQNYGWIKLKYGYVYSKLGMNRAWYTLSQILSAAGV